MNKLSNFVCDNKIKMLTIIILVICSIVAAIIYPNSREYKTITKQLESIVIENDTAYITFIEDDKTYVANNHSGVDLEILKKIPEKTQVTITIENQSKEFKYTVIYIFSVKDDVIFDVIDWYKMNDIVIKTSFIVVPLMMVAVLLVLSFLKLDYKGEKFGINVYNPLEIFIFFTISGTFPLIILLFFYIPGKIQFHTLMYGLIVLIFSALGIIGLITIFVSKKINDKKMNSGIY